jgi:hypothetical protein
VVVRYNCTALGPLCAGVPQDERWREWINGETRCQCGTTVPATALARRVLQELKREGRRSLACRGTEGESGTEEMGRLDVPGSAGLLSSGSSVSDSLAPGRDRIRMKSEKLARLLLSRVNIVSSPVTWSPVQPLA